MRIISGKYNRRILHPPKNLPVRPTTDMAKESLFNILNNKIDFKGTKVLDLFAGTGAISFEFVSRGSSSVLAIDSNQRCVSWIRDAARRLEMDELSALRTDVFKFLERTGTTFDVIFADPPYDMQGIENISKMVFENNLLNPEGILIIEHPKHIDFSNEPGFADHRKYGKVNFSFFRKHA